MRLDELMANASGNSLVIRSSALYGLHRQRADEVMVKRKIN